MKPEEFVKKVVEQYLNNRGVFEKKVNAEELIPNGMSDLQKSLYIFYVLQLDYAMKSQILYNGANKLHKENSEFFTPKYITTITNESLEKYLKEYLHPRYINEAINRYKLNTAVLLEKYNGDPRNIFLNTTEAQVVIKRIKDFRGFGPKIGNFFIRTMINTFEYSYKDIESILPPVDIHDIRIAYLLGYTNTDEMTPKNIKFVKELWNKACIDSKSSWLVFDKALWLLGSEGKPKSKEEILNLIIN